MIRTPFRRFVGALCGALLTSLALVGCAAVPQTAAPSPTSTPEETTIPTQSPAEIAVEKKLSGMTREQKIASLLMLHLPGTDAAALASFMAAHEPGGLILMGDNIAGPLEDTAALTRAATIDAEFPPLIAIDQEGGDVRRLGGDDWASSLTLKDAPAIETEQAFASRAQLLARAGISVNFGIVADVTADPASFIYRRALGTTPDASGERVAAAVLGEQTTVMSTLKHFPGHGAAPGDSHTSVPSTGKTLEEWDATDAVPFRSGIDAGAPLVMFGHLRYDSVDPVPASLSRVWQTILRDRLGFDGITITDDMLMLRDTGLPEFQDTSENAIRALEAGMTMLLYVLSATPADEGAAPAVLVADISAAVDAGRITEQQIDDGARLLLFSRFDLGLEADPLR